MCYGCVVGGCSGKGGTAGGHRTIAISGNRIDEIIRETANRGDGLLSDTYDRGEARVRLGQHALHVASLLEQLGLGLWAGSGPGGRVVQVRTVAAGGGQHVIEARERVEYFSREMFGGSLARQARDLAYDRIRSPQRLDGRE